MRGGYSFIACSCFCAIGVSSHYGIYVQCEMQSAEYPLITTNYL